MQTRKGGPLAKSNLGVFDNGVYRYTPQMVNFHTGNDDSAVDFGGSYFQTDPSHDAFEYGSGSNSYPQIT